MSGEKMKKFIDYYIKGEYHCDTCPYSWDDVDYWGECNDCGCYIKGDICDTCRLLPPFRMIIGSIKKKQYMHFQEHRYDDFVEWFAIKDKREFALRGILEEKLKDFELKCKSGDGTLFTIPTEDVLNSIIAETCDEYEDIVHPVEKESLKSLWGKAFKETISRIRRFRINFRKERE